MSIKQTVFHNGFQKTDNTSSIKKSELAGTLVKIQSYDPSKHTVKIVRADNGKPVIETLNTPTEVNQTIAYEQENSKSLKTLATPDAPIVEVNDHQVSIRGSSNEGFFSTREFGNIVKGATSFSAQPHEIRVGGIMTFNPLLMTGFPSTIVTPIPTFQWSLPSGGMLGPIVKDIALLSTLIGL